MGLVLEIKGNHFKLLYSSDKRCWVPREMLVQMKPQPDSSFLTRLHFLLRRVDADECELVSTEDVHRLSARIDKIDPATIDDIRAYLADKLVSLVVIPEGMAFMQVEIRFR